MILNTRMFFQRRWDRLYNGSHQINAKKKGNRYPLFSELYYSNLDPLG